MPRLEMIAIDAVVEPAADEAPGWQTFLDEQPPMRVPKAADLLADRLRKEIVRGRLAVGEALPPEADMVGTFRVGRPALREALRILESESLIQVRRGSRGGAIVTLPTAALATRAANRLLQYRGTKLRDVYDTRALLEPAAVARLVENGNAAAHRKLEGLLEEEQAVIDDPAAWREVNVRFHQAIVELSGLHSLNLLLRLLQEITEKHVASRVTEFADPDYPSLLARATKAHEKLLSLVGAGEAEEAELFWRDHMQRAGNLLIGDEKTKTVLELFDERAGSRTASGSVKVAEILADTLRSQIVHGELNEGDILPPEPQLAQQMGVGLPALREALRILESESLVTVERGARGGTRIHAPTAVAAARPVGILLQVTKATIEDVYETRAVLELAAVGRLAGRATSRQVTQLEAMIDEGAALLQTPFEWIQYAVRFHATLIEFAGLETLGFLSSVLDELIDRHWTAALAADNRAFDTPGSTAVRGHRRLVKLIAAHDVEGAEAHWRTYLASVQQRLFAGNSQGTVLDLFS